jgi:putative toxin-antitoxin system antitoxin component (TIGR02293 family)
MVHVKYGDQAFAVLGLKGLIRKGAAEETDLAKLRVAIRAGFPSKVLPTLQRAGLTVEQIASATGIAWRTLMRRLNEERLTPIESDRVLRFGAIISDVMDQLACDPRAAIAWLVTPNGALAGDPPLSRLDTEAGVCEVEDALEAEQTIRKARSLEAERKKQLTQRTQRVRYGRDIMTPLQPKKRRKKR